MPTKPKQPPTLHKLRDIASLGRVNREVVATTAKVAQFFGRMKVISGDKGALCTDEKGRDYLIALLKDIRVWHASGGPLDRT